MRDLDDNLFVCVAIKPFQYFQTNLQLFYKREVGDFHVKWWITELQTTLNDVGISFLINVSAKTM